MADPPAGLPQSTPKPVTVNEPASSPAGPLPQIPSQMASTSKVGHRQKLYLTRKADVSPGRQFRHQRNSMPSNTPKRSSPQRRRDMQRRGSMCSTPSFSMGSSMFSPSKCEFTSFLCSRHDCYQPAEHVVKTADCGCSLGTRRRLDCIDAFCSAAARHAALLVDGPDAGAENSIVRCLPSSTPAIWDDCNCRLHFCAQHGKSTNAALRERLSLRYGPLTGPAHGCMWSGLFPGEYPYTPSRWSLSEKAWMQLVAETTRENWQHMTRKKRPENIDEHPHLPLQTSLGDLSTTTSS